MRLPFSALDLAVTGTAITSFLAFVIGHVLVIRYRQPRSSLKALVQVCMMCLVLDLALGLFVVRFAPQVWRAHTTATLAAGMAVSMFIYGVLVFTFVIGVFNLGETARRIRLLRELHRAPGQALTLDEILTVYNADVVLNLRLSRLVRSGQLKFDGHGYSVNAHVFLLQARTLWFMRRLLAIPENKL